MLYLTGKRVLFFAPKFFGYEKDITDALKNMGADVDYYDERPANSVIFKAALRLKAQFLKNSVTRYYETLIKQTKNRNYDFVFIVNAEAITSEIIGEMRTYFHNAKFILYMWDSIRNKKNIVKLYTLFDVTYSFDRLDAANIPGIQFMPLFYGNDFKPSQTATTKYDLSFAGTAHGDRFTIMQKIGQQADSLGWQLYNFQYLHSRLMYLYQCYHDKEFRQKARMKDFSFKPIKKKQLIQIFSSSTAIIDIQHPKQIGLTMRTFEIMGLDRKIITTNADIINYDFYRQENILVIDREHPKIETSFFKVPYKLLPKEVKQKYSIESWVKNIIH